MKKVLLPTIVLFSFLLFSCKTSKKPIDISSSSRLIEYGEEIELSWNVNEKKARKLSLEGLYDSLPLTGKLTLKPDTTVTYRFIIEQKRDEPIKKGYRVRVNVPEFVYFVAPDSTNDEDLFTIRWATRNIKRVDLEGFQTNLPPSGSLKVRLDSTKVLRLVGMNVVGEKISVEKRVKITNLEDFQAPEEIYTGDSATITWKFKLADYVEINGMNKQFKTTDTLKVAPKASTKYRFTIVSKNGDERLHEHKIRVLPPTIVYFSGTKTIDKGDEARLTWLVKGSDNIAIEGVRENLPSKGFLNVSPVRSKTYWLKIKNNKRVKTKHFKVEVVERRNFITGMASVSGTNRPKRMYFDIVASDISRYPGSAGIRVVSVDDDGNFIGKLGENSQQYFSKLDLTAGGKKQTLTKFDVAEIHNNTPKPYDIALALDYSGSMHGRAIDSLETAVKRFINNKNANDAISITKFSDTIKVVVPLQKSKTAILKTANFNGLEYLEGNTALYAGTDMAISTLQGSKNQKIVILFADGNENASFIYHQHRAITAMQLIKKARDNNVKLFIIAYGDEVNNPLFEKIAQLTGGTVYSINKLSDIGLVFKELSLILHNYFDVSFRPMEMEGAHKIELTYNNLISNNAVVSTNMYVGEKYDIGNLEYCEDSYWTDFRGSTNKMTPISPPQAVAFFPFDESILEDKYKPKLQKIADYMLQNKKTEVVIMGHTDSKGSAAYCSALSQRRANMVKSYLQNQGIAANRIKSVPLGQQHPIWDAEEYDWQSHENRRVEVLLLK